MVTRRNFLTLVGLAPISFRYGRTQDKPFSESTEPKSFLEPILEVERQRLRVGREEDAEKALGEYNRIFDLTQDRIKAIEGRFRALGLVEKFEILTQILREEDYRTGVNPDEILDDGTVVISERSLRFDDFDEIKIPGGYGSDRSFRAPIIASLGANEVIDPITKKTGVKLIHHAYYIEYAQRLMLPITPIRITPSFLASFNFQSPKGRSVSAGKTIFEFTYEGKTQNNDVLGTAVHQGELLYYDPLGEGPRERVMTRQRLEDRAREPVNNLTLDPKFITRSSLQEYFLIYAKEYLGRKSKSI